MLVMTLQAVVSSHNNHLAPVIYTSKGIGLLINLFLSWKSESRLHIYSFVSLVTYEIHFQL